MVKLTSEAHLNYAGHLVSNASILDMLSTFVAHLYMLDLVHARSRANEPLAALNPSQAHKSGHKALESLESQGTLQGCMFHLATSQTGHTHPGQPCEKRETVKLWQIFINLRGISWTMPRSIKEALACWNRDGNQSGHRERWKIAPANIWWTIWIERNQRCFENKSCSLQKLKMNYLVLFFFWCKHEYPQEEDDIPRLCAGPNLSKYQASGTHSAPNIGPRSRAIHRIPKLI
ncbi:hypothetical protein H5410_051524 [Solanum commersonii]|uniref:Uncharacterized protein n=1 Tax=Solanum commersonii TaxID=4109 RepID=A0A9J5WYE4_SOLCO|nr:hypothetical protein H5410_051524 [Solanum commersonii]